MNQCAWCVISKILYPTHEGICCTCPVACGVSYCAMAEPAEAVAL